MFVRWQLVWLEADPTTDPMNGILLRSGPGCGRSEEPVFQSRALFRPKAIHETSSSVGAHWSLPEGLL